VQYLVLRKEIEQAELKEQQQAEEDRKRVEMEEKECEEEEARSRMAMEAQHHAWLDTMLREKETEWAQVGACKLTEKAEAEKKRERRESESEGDC
jgi:hypothetical protein